MSPAETQHLESAAGWRRAWPHVVAAVLLFHLVAQAVDCFPDPRMASNRNNWRESRIQAEFSAWADRLGMRKKDLEDQLWALTQSATAVRGAVDGPFRTWMRFTGTSQRWTMFSAGTRERDRFSLIGRTSAGTEVVFFRQADTVESEVTALLSNSRTRSAVFRYGFHTFQRPRVRFCQQIGLNLLDAHPELVSVECRYDRSMSQTPDDARAGTPPTPWKFYQHDVVDRTTARPVTDPKKAAAEPTDVDSARATEPAAGARGDK